MQAMTAASIEPVYTQEAIADINSVEVMLSFQQTSILTALTPRINTWPILSRVGDHDHSKRRLYHFGSDSNFDSNGFRPSSELECHAVREEHITSELPWIVDVTTMEHSFRSNKRHASSQGCLDKGDAQVCAKNSKIWEPKGSQVGPEAHSGNRGRYTGIPSVSAHGHSRSCQPGSWTPKPFSVEQRRWNHIASEQKRRNQVRIRLEELCKLIPELQKRGTSKSDALMKSAKFLESLVKINRELRRRLGYAVGGTG
jgi:Helix-loop-helix DNA-binding domain